MPVFIPSCPPGFECLTSTPYCSVHTVAEVCDSTDIQDLLLAAGSQAAFIWFSGVHVHAAVDIPIPLS